jgi:hypothetical protein
MWRARLSAIIEVEDLERSQYFTLLAAAAARFEGLHNEITFCFSRSYN